MVMFSSLDALTIGCQPLVQISISDPSLRLEYLRALRDSTLKRDTFLASEGRDLMHDRAATSRLAKKCDILAVTTEEVSIFGDPLNSQTLIVQPGVADTSSCLQGRTRKPSHGPKAIVDLHKDDAVSVSSLTGSDQSAGITLRVASLPAFDVTSAIDPGNVSGKCGEEKMSEYRPPEKNSGLLVGLISVVKHLLRNEDVQEKTVLALSWVWRRSRRTLRGSCKLCFSCCQTECSRVTLDEGGREEFADSTPRWIGLWAYYRGLAAVRYSRVAAGGWYRCLEAELAYWWLGEADVGEVVCLASFLSCVSLDTCFAAYV
jgi:hypothetical protein